MKCPECGCQACPNCLGALCDCGAMGYDHDRDQCEHARSEHVLADEKRAGITTEEAFRRL